MASARMEPAFEVGRVDFSLVWAQSKRTDCMPSSHASPLP